MAGFIKSGVSEEVIDTDEFSLGYLKASGYHSRWTIKACCSGIVKGNWHQGTVV
ncbi:unnamed protein product [marine sediment metagenome]|uniref:Uncharacterized protein n=1 Tax=marine sediment metagenome TaxID=412755 RepID=X1LJ49_9ZZZZ